MTQSQTILPAAAQSSKQLNVVLISLDTTRADALHIYGNRNIETPQIDSIGKDGTVFLNNISQAPLTLPSHTAILTGTLPAKNGVKDNTRGHLDSKQATLATLFKQKGYETAAFVSTIVLDHRFGLDQGFDTYDDHIGTREDDSGMEEYERIGEDTAAAAVDWLQQNRASPFFLFVHFYDPHAAYHTHEMSRGYENKYYGEIAYVDAQVGKVLKALQPFQSRTIIVLTADHGEGLGDHDELTHGLFVYDSTLHVPLILSGPGVSKQKQIKTQTRSIDIAPTILALTGLPVPPGMDGRSLVPLMQGASWSESEAISESQYGRSMRWSPLYSLRTSEWKYIEAPKPELYHLNADPYESNNVIQNFKAVAYQMQRKILPYKKQSMDTKQDLVADPELQEKLKSLGYVSGTAAGKDEESLVDPKDKVPVWKCYEQALFAFYDGRQEKAVELLRKAIAMDSSVAVLYDAIARMGYRANTEKQIEYLRKAAALEPEDDNLHRRLATCYRKIRQYQSSIAEEELALKINPQNIEALHGEGTTYLEMGLPGKALLFFQQILELDPNNANATHQEGTCYRSLGQIDKAIALYEKAIRFNPSIPDSYNALGVIYAQQKDYSRAVDYFQKSIQLNPKFSEAYFNLGTAYQKTGKNKEAVESFQKFIEKADPADYASRIETARRWIDSQS